MNQKKLQKHEGDVGLWILTLAISLFGVIMVYSASYYESLTKYGNGYHYLINAAMWFGGGWLVYLLCSIIPYKLFKGFFNGLVAIALIFIAFVLLVLLLTPVGTEYNNATRWIEIGPITIMPGEIFKTASIFFFAWLFEKEGNEKKRSRLWISLAIAIAAFVLIYMQPNLSTAIIVFVIIAGILFAAGVNWIYYLIGLVAVVVGVIVLLNFGPEYMVSRFTSFLDPWADALGQGYQVCQGLIALGSGGFLGLGLGNSVQKAYYLPEPQNDFILTIIGEELGFVGVVVLLIVYAALIYRIISISMKCKSRFASLFCSGVGIHFALQVLLNLAVCVSLAPATGVTLPLISLGGNSLLLFMAELGLVQNFSKHTDEI